MLHVDNFNGNPQSFPISVQQKKQAYGIRSSRYACYDPVSFLKHPVFPDIVQYLFHRSSSIVSFAVTVCAIRPLHSRLSVSRGLQPARSYHHRPFCTGASGLLPGYPLPFRKHFPSFPAEGFPEACPLHDFPERHPGSRRKP